MEAGGWPGHVIASSDPCVATATTNQQCERCILERVLADASSLEHDVTVRGIAVAFTHSLVERRLHDAEQLARVDAVELVPGR